MLVKKLRRLRRLTFQEACLLIEAAILVAFIRGGLACLGLRRLMRILSWLGSGSRRILQKPASYCARVSWAVTVVGRRLARERPCLIQALAVQLLFRRAGYPADLRIGVARGGNGRLQAHAWIESNGKIVVGGAASPHMYESFPVVEVSDSKGVS